MTGGRLMLAGWRVRENVKVSSALIYMQTCVAYTLLQMLSSNTLPQNILLKRCQTDLAPTSAWPACQPYFQKQCSVCLSAASCFCCRSLRSCCSLGVQITIWAVQQIFGSSKIWYWWSSSGAISVQYLYKIW